ncbi:MAG TPA: rhodanese-like domain-containing protein [Verrucomicrobiota bacterium]|nr:sulfurtransferase [Verrucomicrobiales bacterium]HRI11948.1 rhodanese-like domain-containing protein [Verrucomicrobiota bacterium]
MTTITPADLYQRLSQSPNLTLLDVRTPLEFDEMHVSQAINEPLDQISPATLVTSGRLKKSEPVYLICRTDTRSTKAAEKMVREGFREVVIVEGGTLAWEAAGLPLRRSGVKTVSLERQVRIVAGALVFGGVVLGWWVHPGFFGLAAIVGAGLVFAGVTDFCGMGLLLAKLPWNQRRSTRPLAPAQATVLRPH